MKVKLAAIGLILAELVFVASFVYTHLTTFSGANVGFNLNAPYDLVCVGTEYMRGSHQFNGYLGFGVDNCKTN